MQNSAIKITVYGRNGVGVQHPNTTSASHPKKERARNIVKMEA